VAGGGEHVICAGGEAWLQADVAQGAQNDFALPQVAQGQLASYANRGSFVSAGAPGTSIVFFNNQPYQVTGTSTSAAYTTGLAAGYMDNKHSTAGQAQTFILNNFGVKITTSASGQSGH